MVKIPALVTLVVSVVRLVGELAGAPASWFGTEAGSVGSYVGIVWLVPVFGVWFGWRLVRTSAAPERRGIAFFWSLVALAVLVGGTALVYGVVDPDYPMTLAWLGGVAIATIVVAAKAWPALAWTNLGYGVLARIPVVLITALAFWLDWDTHHVKSRVPQLDPTDELTLLCGVQLLFWVPFTVAVGGVAGTIGAFLGSRGAD